jgi:hypothetical protein
MRLFYRETINRFAESPLADVTLNKFVGAGTDAEMAAFTPDPPSPATAPDNGYVFWNTTDQVLYAWDVGTAAWVAVTGGGAGITQLTGDGTAGPGAGSQVLTIAANAVTTAKILNANVTLAKIANAAANSKLLGSGAAGSGAAYAELTLGTNLSMAGTTLNASGSAGQVVPLGLVFEGGGVALTTGVKGDLSCPFAATITSVTLLADQSGSVVVDIWKDTYGNYPPTVADTITAAAKPTISGAVKSQDVTLTGWTTAVSAGDTLRFNIDSAATITRLTIQLSLTRTS